MIAPIPWLLQGDPWIEYRTRVDLLHQTPPDQPVMLARERMLVNPQVQSLLTELTEWPWKVISSHKSAGQPFHKLTFLADLGLIHTDPGMEIILSRILDHQSDEGPFMLRANIPTHFGGSGEDQWAWALCDAPLLVYALVRFGLAEDTRVKKAVVYLSSLVRENGWPCAVSKELGSFHGPGRKEDPCPFATLAMLKLLSAAEEWQDSSASRAGVEALLHLWKRSETSHPYIFYMGTDFRKLKVPFIWYDLVHVLDVLSRFTWCRQDPRLHSMLEVLENKMDPQGCFTLESVWTAWKDWEFGQKKEPSRWLTLAAWRIIEQIRTH